MAYSSDQDHSITLSEASQMTANYRTANPGAVKGHFYGKDAIQAIFNQTGCVGIRVYYGIDSSGARQLIFVGVDSSGNDLYQGDLAERGSPCPSYCSTANSLNS